MQAQFHSVTEFIHMGGYAFYVWLAYGVAYGALAILIGFCLTRKNRVLKEIAAKVKREERLAQHRSNRQ
ncbi:heme exporter protein CcmD [Shewanella yunxiaonensis]|uniref:Heme exporter protein D n=2 Tax=Shewanellaceae TaxID=267890 RepID=A0ABX7YY28_9GAMM|nr:heme exporter protein CcmD [Shewanella yunxiaonensis]